MTTILKTVDISPGVNVLSVFQYLNYKAWYALAEFVDNSLQSAIDNVQALYDVEGAAYRLLVDIRFDDDHNTITVEDNAAGINVSDFARALKTAQLPPDRTGLSEFGVGLKSAAFWFSRNWSVETSALGETVSRRVTFDLENIIAGAVAELPIVEEPAEANKHYTRIVLLDVYRMPRGRTLGKVRSHLESIYRMFERNGVLRLMIDGREAEYKEVPILTAAPAWQGTSERQQWKKPISFDFGKGLKVTGFAAIRERGSTSDAGFALFRRGRLIQGSGDDAYRPEAIFGRGNSFRSQRLFGELELTGFNVTHTKDGFQWDENEGPFLDLLAEDLNRLPLSLLRQADEYRVNVSAPQRTPQDPGENCNIDGIADLQPAADDDVDLDYPNDDSTTQEYSLLAFDPNDESAVHAELSSKRFDFIHAGELWQVDVHFEPVLPNGDLYFVQQEASNDSSVQKCAVRVNFGHSSITPFVDRLDEIAKIFAALGAAENSIRMTGSVMPGSIRRTVNGLLKT